MGCRFPSAGDIHPDTAVDPRCLYPRPLQAATPSITRLRLLRHTQVPQSGKATPEAKVSSLLQSLGRKPTASKRQHLHILLASTPTSSTHVDAKGGGKSVRDDVTYLL